MVEKIILVLYKMPIILNRKTYLGESQYVLTEVISNTHVVVCCILQGSVSAPLRFNIGIKDITNHLCYF